MNNRELLNMLLQESIQLEAFDPNNIANITEAIYKAHKTDISSFIYKATPSNELIAGNISPMSLFNQPTTAMTKIPNGLSIKPLNSESYSKFTAYLYAMDSINYQGYTSPDNIYATTKGKHTPGSMKNIRFENGVFYAPDGQSKPQKDKEGNTIQVKNFRSFVPLVDIDIVLINDDKEVVLDEGSKNAILQALYANSAYADIWFKEVQAATPTQPEEEQKTQTDNIKTTSLTSFSKEDLNSIKNTLSAAIKNTQMPVTGVTFGMIKESQIKKFKEADEQQQQQFVIKQVQKPSSDKINSDSIEVLVSFTFNEKPEVNQEVKSEVKTNAGQ